MEIQISKLPLLLLLSFILSSQFPAYGEFNCNMETTGDVFFQSFDRSDSMKVSIQGESCEDSTLRIVILNSDSEVLYSYRKHLSQIYYLGDPDEHLIKRLEEIIIRIVSFSNSKKSSDFPKLLEPEAFYDEYNFTIAEGKEQYYEKLRSMNRPVVYHPTYTEGGLFVTLDETENKPIVFLYWGY